MKKIFRIPKLFIISIIHQFSYLFVDLYGGFWELKKMCHEDPTKFKILVYDAYQTYFSSDINEHSNFKGIPILPHGLNGIFITGAATIGENCVIFQQVTIGSNTLLDSKNSGSPTIGNNVYIGAGAKIIGNVKVGDNARIGANAVVVKDVPDNSIVVIESMKTVTKDYILDNTHYYLDTYLKIKETTK